MERERQRGLAKPEGTNAHGFELPKLDEQYDSLSLWARLVLCTLIWMNAHAQKGFRMAGMSLDAETNDAGRPLVAQICGVLSVCLEYSHKSPLRKIWTTYLVSEMVKPALTELRRYGWVVTKARVDDESWATRHRVELVVLPDEYWDWVCGAMKKGVGDEEELVTALWQELEGGYERKRKRAGSDRAARQR